MRTLKQIADAINADPSLGLSAFVEKSWSNTDSKIAGTRFIRMGRGRSGNKITVRLARTGEIVCQHDTSQTYRTAGEVAEWLDRWRRFERYYMGAPGHLNQERVAGEPKKAPKQKKEPSR